MRAKATKLAQAQMRNPTFALTAQSFGGTTIPSAPPNTPLHGIGV
jgi:hypothetical protein